jgi:hypothetical protein
MKVTLEEVVQRGDVTLPRNGEMEMDLRNCGSGLGGMVRLTHTSFLFQCSLAKTSQKVGDVDATVECKRWK